MTHVCRRGRERLCHGGRRRDLRPGYAAQMVNQLLEERLDMVVGTRVAPQCCVPVGHQLGNRLLTFAVANLFGKRFSDMLSGLPGLFRRFVKSFPAMSGGFNKNRSGRSTHWSYSCRSPRLSRPTGFG